MKHGAAMKHGTVFLTALLLAPVTLVAAEPLISPDKLKSYIERFNAEDREVYPTTISNAQTLDFLQANAPLFDCPDKDIEQTYYFRWWTFRKHLTQTPDGWVITEFLPVVPWAGKYNTINCANGHQIREARWLKDRRYVEDTIRFWFQKGSRIIYSSWLPEAVWAYCTTLGDYRLAKELLPDLIKHYKGWETDSIYRGDTMNTASIRCRWRRSSRAAAWSARRSARISWNGKRSGGWRASAAPVLVVISVIPGATFHTASATIAAKSNSLARQATTPATIRPCREKDPLAPYPPRAGSGGSEERRRALGQSSAAVCRHAATEWDALNVIWPA